MSYPTKCSLLSTMIAFSIRIITLGEDSFECKKIFCKTCYQVNWWLNYLKTVGYFSIRLFLQPKFKNVVQVYKPEAPMD